MVFEIWLPIYGVDEIPPLFGPFMLRVDHARWDQTPADLRELAMSASHPRTRERFLALYEITQESCATRVAAQARRHPVMEWLHLYNTRGPEATSAPAPPLPGDRGRPW